MENNTFEQFQTNIAYFREKQNTYDKLDVALVRFDKAARGKYVPRMKTIFQYILLLALPIMASSWIFVTEFLTERIVFDIKAPLETIIINSRVINRTLTFALLKVAIPFLISYVVASILYVIYRLIKKRVIEYTIENRRQNIIDIVRDLSIYYNNFEATIGMPPIMNSYKQCNPKELAKIENILLARDADTIPDARAILVGNGEIIDYSIIPRSFEITKREMNRINAESGFKSGKGDNASKSSARNTGKAKREPKSDVGGNYSNQSQNNDNTQSNTNSSNSDTSTESLYFKGIEDLDSLKKRYRALMRAYHTDGEVGDTETAQAINEEYSKLRKKLK